MAPNKSGKLKTKTRLIHLVLLQLIQRNKSIASPKLWQLMTNLPADIQTTFGFQITSGTYREILRQLQECQFIQLNYYANYNEITLTTTGESFLSQAQRLMSSIILPASSSAKLQKKASTLPVSEAISIRDFEERTTAIASSKIQQILESPHEKDTYLKQLVKEVSELALDLAK